ncbi:MULTISPECIES: hypothetical protein [unclassified Nocardioides]|uniref:hypothetical protein n=1 Tax=unclassified Nocardioides TaxID=2615069 RepID=UPI000702813F|nr:MULTISPECIES: hypothetical protein [unclassified Nocardioides]KRC53018.1 hypothetical protein ASE19_11540 [Nocardioides sp. Root79]KRC72547.1 hypothetical protein ASE20_08070 [Nocardioides sp. Root240]
MSQVVEKAREEDRAAVHHFIRLMGHAPTDEELTAFRQRPVDTERARRRTMGLRPRAARLLVRL